MRGPRACGSDRTPILLLTAQDAIASKVTALDSGADDYIVKLFNLDELLAGMKALLRRGNSRGTPVLEWENLCQAIAAQQKK